MGKSIELEREWVANYNDYKQDYDNIKGFFSKKNGVFYHRLWQIMTTDCDELLPLIVTNCNTNFGKHLVLPD